MDMLGTQHFVLYREVVLFRIFCITALIAKVGSTGTQFITLFHSFHCHCTAGHGFKLSPVVGKILSELALDLQPSYDLSPFKINRFKTYAKL